MAKESSASAMSANATPPPETQTQTKRIVRARHKWKITDFQWARHLIQRENEEFKSEFTAGNGAVFQLSLIAHNGNFDVEVHCPRGLKWYVAVTTPGDYGPNFKPLKGNHKSSGSAAQLDVGYISSKDLEITIECFELVTIHCKV